jgi:hypothetical protein
MSQAHVFVETNFLISIFQLPSKRRPDALALKTRFDIGATRLSVPYVCFQEARTTISKLLRGNRWPDLLEFHRYASAIGQAHWNFEEIKKLLDAATAEINRTKAVNRGELDQFAAALGDGVLHGANAVFDLLETIELDDDSLKYNDKLILCSCLVKAAELHARGIRQLFFASVDTSDLQPTVHRPKLTQRYNEVGLAFIPNFQLPDSHPSVP